MLKSISFIEDLENQELQILNNVYGDPRRFIQILQNFLSNAVKFTNKYGDVIIRVYLLEVQDILSKEHKECYKVALEQNLGG